MTPRPAPTGRSSIATIQVPTNQVHTFDEAITMAGNGRFQLVVLFVCGTSLMASISEGLNMAFVLPIARCDLQISLYMQGLINSVGFIGVIISSHLWGFLADTWGRKRVLQTALGLTFVSCCVSSMSYTSLMLLITRLAVGLSVSGVQAAGISYMGEFHNDRNRSRYVTLAVTGMTISISYQSLLALAILPQDWSVAALGLQYTPWRLFLLLNGLIIGVACAVMFALPESPKYLLATGRPAEALQVLRQVYRWNAGNGADAFAVQSIRLDEAGGSNLRDARTLMAMVRLMWAQTWPLFRPPHVARLLMLFYVVFAMFLVAHGVYLWLPQILDLYYERMDEAITLCGAIALASASGLAGVDVVAANRTFAMDAAVGLVTDDDNDVCFVSQRSPLTYIITTAFGVCFFVMFVSAAMTIQRIGNRNLMVSWLLVNICATLAVVWNIEFVSNIVLLMLMNSNAPAASLMTAEAANLFPTHLKGMAISLILMVSRIGSITGSNVVGALLFTDCTALLAIDAALLVASAAVYILIFRLNVGGK